MHSRLAQRAARLRHAAGRAATSRLGANVASLYAAQGLNYLVPLIVLPYLLRVLGPVPFGAIAFAQSFATYLQILTDFGFNFSATRSVSLCRDQPQDLARIFWTTLAAKAGLLLAAALVLFPVVWYLPVLHRHGTVIGLSCLAVLGSVLLPQWYWQGLERMRTMVIMQVGGKLCMLAAVFALVHAPSDEAKAAAILALPALLAGGACLAAVAFMDPVRWYRPTARDVWDAMTSSWHLFVSGAATSLYVNSNVFLIGLICGDYQVALYSLANKIALAVFGMLTPIAQAAFPRASLLFGRAVPEGKAFVRRLSRYVAVLAGALSVGLVASAGELVKAFGGPRFVGAVPVLRIMGLLPLALAAATILAQMVMINVGLARQLSRIYLAAGIASLCLLPPLASRFGAVGGAESLLIIESAGPVLMALAIRRSRLLRPQRPAETG